MLQKKINLVQQDKIRSAYNLLSLTNSKEIGVAISFGKDSLATLDLIVKSGMFKKIVGFYLYRAANLETVKRWNDNVSTYYGIEIKMYPHFDLYRLYKNHILQPHWKINVPKITMADIENYFRQECGVKFIAMGWRRNDSFSRAMIMKQCAGIDYNSERVFPLRSWTSGDVKSYLVSRGIVIPNSLGRKEQGGLDFHPESIKFLSDNDRKRIFNDFPFAGIQIFQEHP